MLNSINEVKSHYKLTVNYLREVSDVFNKGVTGRAQWLMPSFPPIMQPSP